MRKVLLIKPPFHFIPIGMGYVLACLERSGIPVDFLDMHKPAGPVEQYMRRLAAGEYMAVGTGGFVYSTNWFRETLIRFRSLCPQTPIILGGNITKNVRMDLLLNHLPIDFAVVGEAESCFPQLLHALAEGTDYRSIPGLAFKDRDGNIVKNPYRRVALDQEDYVPAYEATDLQYYIDSYRHHVVPGLGRMMPVLTGRGCKGGCSFCSPTVGRFLPRRIDNILREIETWNRRYQFDWITFATEVFFTSDEDILEFCREYKKAGFRKPWGCCFRMDQSPELLPIMKDAGCAMICAGLESGSENILPKLKHGCTVDQFRKTLDAVRKVGLVVDSPFMIANEDETEEDLNKTVDFLIENRMDANFGLVGTYPGTPIYVRALKKGLIGDEWEYITKRLMEWAWRHPSLLELSYMNISAMPAPEMFTTIFRQIRRFLTFQYREFRAHDQSLNASSNGNGAKEISIAGHCLNCGTRHSLAIRDSGAVSVVEYLFRCNRCHQKNFLHFTDLPQTREYYNALAAKLREARKIMVLGTGKNAMDFFFYDLFGLDLDQIVGFVDLRGSATEKKFYHLPCYRLADLESVDYDAILVADVRHDVANLLLGTSTAAQHKPTYFLAPSELT
ncbi:MAG TPA: radical SAM protein [Sedimentisphaerales bacterium]|jgi:radical SAM superfamily enzyme YgiQ (UPF0313 family)|nr:radical SAM protein [Sedimentisphaerales bacterium]HNU27757.1 radical SAM protein [Sedimentisphaerales bacterium]